MPSTKMELFRRRFKKQILRNWTLYLFVLPAFIYITILHYVPLYGIQIAFRTPFQGLRKVTQSMTYAPYFISVVVMCGMLTSFFSSSGIVNQIIKLCGGNAVDFLNYDEYWRTLYVGSGVWRTSGYNAVIYIAALAGVSPELHEAATMDGANRIQRIWHIDIPSILPTIVILLILRCGRIMSVGFQKAYLLQNDLNLGVSEIIATYVYKMGLQKGQYSLSTAVGLFNNIINFLLVISVNKISDKLTGSGLW